MAKYIDKSVLVAEIEKLKEENKPNSKSMSEYIKGGIYGFDLAIEKTLSTIDTLEVKEVDLEKEFYDFLDTLTGKDDGHLSENELFRIAEYFYELGMQQSKKTIITMKKMK